MIYQNKNNIYNDTEDLMLDTKDYLEQGDRHYGVIPHLFVINELDRDADNTLIWYQLYLYKNDFLECIKIDGLNGFVLNNLN